MADNEKKKVMEEEVVIDVDLKYQVKEEEGTPLCPVLCLKNKMEIRDFEEKEDCFILDFDPYETLGFLANLSVSSAANANADADSPEVSVVSERGQVACRDFPHSRESCAKYPFEKTSHESYCELCYCFVCDIAAPCKDWSGTSGHCHAVNNEVWNAQRKVMKQLQKPTSICLL